MMENWWWPCSSSEGIHEKMVLVQNLSVCLSGPEVAEKISKRYFKAAIIFAILGGWGVWKEFRPIKWIGVKINIGVGMSWLG